MHLNLLSAVERSGFVKRYNPVLVAGTKSKKCDKQLTFIVRVIVNCFCLTKI
jgi:hypothetical protein